MGTPSNVDGRASGLRSDVVRALALAVVYFAAAKLGLRLAFAADQVSPVWPPTGIALAAVVLLGPRIWPGIALGAFLANVTAHETVVTAASIAAGNTLETLAGGRLLQVAGVRAPLDRLTDVLGLLTFGAGLSTMLSATIGVTSLCAGGAQPWNAYESLWWTWWIGDAMGNLVAAPLLLAWAARPRSGGLPPRAFEGSLLVGALLAVSVPMFSGRLVFTGYPYLIFPFVVWAALRFGQRGTTVVTLCVSTIAIWFTVNG